MKDSCFATNLSSVHLRVVIPVLWHTSLRVWVGFVWLRMREKVSLWSRRVLVPWFCKVSLGNGKKSFLSVMGQMLERDPAGRGQAEQSWWQWDVQPARGGREDGLRGFSSPFAVSSGLFTY